LKICVLLINLVFNLIRVTKKNSRFFTRKKPDNPLPIHLHTYLVLQYCQESPQAMGSESDSYNKCSSSSDMDCFGSSLSPIEAPWGIPLIIGISGAPSRDHYWDSSLLGDIDFQGWEPRREGKGTCNTAVDR